MYYFFRYTNEDQLGRIYLPTRHLFFGVGGVFSLGGIIGLNTLEKY
ncbi:hypothetical protein LAA29_120057 [Leuconostoc carnosum]|nr:hypothetical protein LCAC16_130055 [Leuconostoc carnosum]SPO33182.1 hypothetical protein LAA29_120057 [Leuconostoc carnosum]